MVSSHSIEVKRCCSCFSKFNHHREEDFRQVRCWKMFLMIPGAPKIQCEKSSSRFPFNVASYSFKYIEADLYAKGNWELLFLLTIISFLFYFRKKKSTQRKRLVTLLNVFLFCFVFPEGIQSLWFLKLFQAHRAAKPLSFLLALCFCINQETRATSQQEMKTLSLHCNMNYYVELGYLYWFFRASEQCTNS